MIYLAANNSRVWHYRQLDVPMGWMMSPKGWRCPVRGDNQMPYALDNGMYHAPNDPPKGDAELAAFYVMLGKIEPYHPPMFAVAPDVPYDGDRSRQRSKIEAKKMREAGYEHPIAVAVQDGMVPDDLEGYDCVFIAGSTEWKWNTVGMWADAARERGIWCHVARVNTIRRVRQCVDYGVGSADGTGIWRGDRQQLRGVLDALTEKTLF